MLGAECHCENGDGGFVYAEGASLQYSGDFRICHRSRGQYCENPELGQHFPIILSPYRIMWKEASQKEARNHQLLEN